MVPVIALLLFGTGAVFAQADRPAAMPGFVGSQACGTCHAAEADAWKGSHHAWALKEPTPDTVLGDFGDASLEHKGIRTRFFREGDDFLVETDGADGKPAVFRIAYVVGVAPLQQYLVELDRGRLQALDVAWDVESGRWFHLYPNDDVSSSSGLHWTGAYKNWQARCAVCHQTDFRKNYDQQQRTYRSSWSDLTVGCESCHGPGAAHVDWAGDSGSRPAPAPGLSARGFLLAGARDRATAMENMCGPCHSRREDLAAQSSPPAGMIADHFNLATLGGGLYFADGQQDQEVYILGSFLQSKMRVRGVTCSDCHDPHSGRLVAEGNAVCTQCHNEAGRREFPTLSLKNYDSPDHYRHPEGSAASACVSCHMPERTYMQVDGRRDHFFRVPDPLLSQKVGSPDACLGCHADRDAAWAAAAIDDWAPDRSRPVSGSAELFFAVRQSGLDDQSMARLAALAKDTGETEIVRASALREIGAGADAATRESLAGLLSDGSDLVRSAAIGLWRSAAPPDRLARLQPLLSDPRRAVRIAAALELASLDGAPLPPQQRGALEAAIAELRTSLAAKADFPEGQMAIGGLAMTSRNWEAAEAAFAEAVFLDPGLVQAWMARVRIATAVGDGAGATAILTAARRSNPDDVEIARQLAILLLQQGRPGAAPLLRQVVATEPGNFDMRMALAMALVQDRELPAAAVEIDRLERSFPDRPEVLMLHAFWQIGSNDLAGAQATVRKIEQRFPGIRLPPALAALSRAP